MSIETSIRDMWIGLNFYNGIELSNLSTEQCFFPTDALRTFSASLQYLIYSIRDVFHTNHSLFSNAQEIS